MEDLQRLAKTAVDLDKRGEYAAAAEAYIAASEACIAASTRECLFALSLSL
jgi:hypothetical protein